MKKNTIPYILILLIILLTPTIIADPEQYLFPGVSRDSTYQQDGTGVWTGRTPVQKLRTYTNIQSYFPLVADVTGDGNNEIIILADNNLVLLNYTEGVGLLIVQTISHGTTSISTTKYSVTPGLLDTDSDGISEIISWNTTHMLMYSYNGTEIVLNQSTPTSFNTATTATASSFVTPVIKCAKGIQFHSGKDTCVFPASNRSGGTIESIFTVYNVDDNTVQSIEGIAAANNDPLFHNTHLIDGDGDGYLEAYVAYKDTANGRLRVYKSEINTTSTFDVLFSHDLSSNRPHTDIIVSDLYGDGGSLDITFGYSADLTNYDAATYNADTGAVLDAGYCSIITCPEGQQLSSNMILASDTTYCDFSGDVYYYIRNYETDEDHVLCLSQYAGAGFEKTSITNTQNFTSFPIIHQASVHGSEGIITSKFTIQGSAKQSLPELNDGVIIPVDAQKSGSLDMIGIYSNTLTYYDDAYTNSNYEITGIEWDTDNPICQYEQPTFTLTIQDTEEDAGVCYYTETHANGTVVSTSSNNSISASSFTSEVATTSFNHYTDEIGTFTLSFYCKDQYNSVYDTTIYSIRVSNTSGCFYKGQGGGSTQSDATSESESEEFLGNVDSVFSDIGIDNSSGKAMFWLILMICLAFIIFSSYSGHGIVYIIALLEVVMLVLGWVLGMIGSVVLVIIGLVTALLLTYMLLKGNPGQG